MGLYSDGLILGWAYTRVGLYSGGLIRGSLRYNISDFGRKLKNQGGDTAGANTKKNNITCIMLNFTAGKVLLSRCSHIIGYIYIIGIYIYIYLIKYI